MKVDPNKGSKKIKLKNNGCHGYLMGSSQISKIEKKSVNFEELSLLNKQAFFNSV